MGEQWYCMVVGQEVGPITSDDLLAMLEQGQIDADDSVRDGTEGDWRPVRDAIDVSGIPVNPATEVATAVADDSPSGRTSNGAASKAVWFTRLLGSEFGPFTIEEIREQAADERLAPDDELKEGANGQWVSASTVAGLFSESAIRQRTIEIEQDREERDRKKRERKERRRQRKSPGGKSNEMLSGLDELEDVEAARSVSPFAGFDRVPTDPSEKAELLKKLDAEYQRLRGLLTDGAPVPASPARSFADSGGVATSPDAPSSSHALSGSSGFDNPNRGASSPGGMQSPASPPPEPERSPAANMMRDMAAAQIRASQTPARPTPRPSYKPSSGGGGGGFSMPDIDFGGSKIGIVAAVLGVLVVGYFGWGMLDLSSGAVYEELVSLNAEYKKVAEADASSADFKAFYDKFKKQQGEMLRDLGNPSAGSTAFEVRRGVLAMGTALEAQRRPDMTPEKRQPFIQAYEKQMTSLKQSFGE